MLHQVHESPSKSVRFACCGGNALKQLKQSLERDLRQSSKSGRFNEVKSIWTDIDDLEDMLEGVE